jgi:hypothetical protein
MEDLDFQLERETFNLAYDRWLLLYKDRVLGQVFNPDEAGEIPLDIDDLSELDRYMEEQERAYQAAASREENLQKILHGKRTMSGAQAEPLQWGPWR